VSNSGGDSVTVLLRQPGTSFAPDTGSPYAVGTTPIGIVAADFDGDGRIDLAVANSASNNLTVLLRQPTRGFAAQPPVALPAGPYGLAVADFDSNVSPDLAVALTSANSVSVLFNEPNPVADAGLRDASLSDASFSDASSADASASDASFSEAGLPDAGRRFGGAPTGDNGCSCRFVGRREAGGAFGLVIALVGLALTRTAPRRNHRG
jgi:hypothetical protein